MSDLSRIIGDFVSGVVSEALKIGSLCATCEQEELDRKSIEVECGCDICIDVDKVNVVVKNCLSREVVLRLLMVNNGGAMHSASLLVNKSDTDIRIGVEGPAGRGFTVEALVPEESRMLNIVSAEGNVVVKGLRGNNLKLRTETGNVVCKDVIMKTVEIVSQSGNIVVKNVRSESPVAARSKIGNVVMNNG